MSHCVSFLTHNIQATGLGNWPRLHLVITLILLVVPTYLFWLSVASTYNKCTQNSIETLSTRLHIWDFLYSRVGDPVTFQMLLNCRCHDPIPLVTLTGANGNFNPITFRAPHIPPPALNNESSFNVIWSHAGRACLWIIGPHKDDQSYGFFLGLSFSSILECWFLGKYPCAEPHICGLCTIHTGVPIGRHHATLKQFLLYSICG